MSVTWDIDHNLESKASLNSQEFICLGIMAVQWLARFPLEHSYSLSLHALVGFFWIPKLSPKVLIQAF